MTIETYGSHILDEPEGKPPGRFSADNPNPPPAINLFFVNAQGERVCRYAHAVGEYSTPMTSPTLRCATRGSQATRGWSRQKAYSIPTRGRSSVRKVLKSVRFPSNQDVSDIRVEHSGASLLGSSFP